MNKQENKMNYIAIISWIFVLIWMGVIFMFSEQNSTESSELSSGISDTVYVIVDDTFPDADVSQETIQVTTRNVAHFLLYFVLGFLVLNALSNHNISEMKRPLFAFVLSALYALSDEWHQYYVPGRAFELKDLSIDLAGAILGISLLFVVVRIIDSKNVAR
jgi:VanZ family protein